MKINFKPKCPGCSFTTTISCRKPGVMGSMIVNYECEACGSMVQLKISRNLKEKNQINVIPFSILASDTLIKMKQEEQAERDEVKSGKLFPEKAFEKSRWIDTETGKETEAPTP